MTDEPLDRCPDCGGAVERLLSAGAGLLFKGTGFYITDYRSESYKKAAAADADGATSDGKSKKSESSSKAGGNSASSD